MKSEVETNSIMHNELVKHYSKGVIVTLSIVNFVPYSIIANEINQRTYNGAITGWNIECKEKVKDRSNIKTVFYAKILVNE